MLSVDHRMLCFEGSEPVGVHWCFGRAGPPHLLRGLAWYARVAVFYAVRVELAVRIQIAIQRRAVVVRLFVGKFPYPNLGLFQRSTLCLHHSVCHLPLMADF